MPRGNTIVYRIAQAVFEGKTFDGASDLARALDTTPSAVAPWGQRLIFHRIMRRTRDGLRFDEDRFLTYLTSLRAATLQPEAEFVVPFSSPDEALERVQHVPHVSCMFTAGNSWAFFEPRRDLHLYVDRRTLPALRDALPRGRPSVTGSTRIQVYVEPLHRIHHVGRQGRPVTTPLFTTIDLRAHPEGGAHAEFLRRNLLPRIRVDD